MSSFKRKDSSKQSSFKSYTGTRASPASSSTINTSTGITSLDDILGGGLPLSCSLVVAAPDPHSLYGSLVQKYFVAEGLACGHRICIFDGDAEDFLKDVMWYPKSTLQSEKEKDQASPPPTSLDEDEEKVDELDQKVKIAWRYEQLKPFQTTIIASSSSENYCHIFDLTSRLPLSIVAEFQAKGLLSLEAPHADATERVTESALRCLERVLQEQDVVPVRLCIPSLGSPTCWGDISPKDVLHFLYSLRALLRQYPHGCASITLSPHLLLDNGVGSAFLQKVGWLADACLSLAAFSSNPSMSAMFPSHHGFVHLLSLPSPTTLVAPSDRFSTLRGLASSASGFGGSGENNLAFKCTRKRLIFETLHLDLDGGVSERRTTVPSTVVAEMATTTALTSTTKGSKAPDSVVSNVPGTKIHIEFEAAPSEEKESQSETVSQPLPSTKKFKKTTKKVAFFSDRPDVYDF